MTSRLVIRFFALACLAMFGCSKQEITKPLSVEGFGEIWLSSASEKEYACNSLGKNLYEHDIRYTGDANAHAVINFTGNCVKEIAQFEQACGKSVSPSDGEERKRAIQKCVDEKFVTKVTSVLAEANVRKNEYDEAKAPEREREAKDAAELDRWREEKASNARRACGLTSNSQDEFVQCLRKVAL